MTIRTQTSVDPATFEVLKNKLQSVVNEQTITLKRVSGSPIVTEGGDFNSGLYLPDSTAVVLGQENIGHASTLAHMIRNTFQDCRENPGVHEGDMFFLNDPWKGASHQSDVGIVAPHFYRGELIAWSGSVCHLLDVGGMTPGSWCTKATECYQEGVAFPPIEIVQSGVIRQDVVNVILNQSRLPFLTTLDLKAMIASNNIAIKRVLELIDRYGLEQVQAVMNGLVERAEKGMRRKLAELPDGKYRGVDFIDHDGHANRIYKIAVTLIKEGDSITFDFSGTSPQAPGFINCTEAGMECAVAMPLFVTLGYDLPWNGGFMRPVKIVAEKGIICNAQRPAPVSGASVMAKRVVINACTQAISRLVSCHPKYGNEARALSSGTFMTLNLRGISQYGERYGTMIMDAAACGEGAYCFRDGIHGEGNIGTPRSSIPDVENNEDFAPVMFLYRKVIRDTGGAGKYKGGNTLGVAFTVTTDKPQNAVLCGHGVEVPNCTGVSGGGPGACVVNTLIRNTDLKNLIAHGRIPVDISQLGGRPLNVGAKPGELVFNPGDVFAYSFQGGGGWGDPLEKAPQNIVDEVAEGNISVDWARRAFGVVIDPASGQLKEKETTALRKRMRRQRIARAKGVEIPLNPPLKKGENVGVGPLKQGEKREPVENLHPLGESLRVVMMDGTKAIQCQCGHIFGPASENWKSRAVKYIVPPRDYGPCVKTHRELEMREYICPACGILHSVEIARKEDPPLWEAELSLRG